MADNTIQKLAVKRKRISKKMLKLRVDYSPETGNFIWKPRKKNPLWTGKWAGKVAGRVNCHGYIAFPIDGRMYTGHRLAWLYMTGEWPQKEIDHINGIRSDNRWENLRLASKSQNKQNVKLSSRNTSGFKGVSWSRQNKKWIAQIAANGCKIHLGGFDTKELAYEAYCLAAGKLHGEFAKLK